MDFDEFLEAQRALQVSSFGGDPSQVEGEARADYVMYNALALSDELHEALLEVGWKPWLTVGRGEWIDRDGFVKELIDLLHFLGNLFLVAEVTGDEIAERYLRKRQVNKKRQEDGYDGKKDEEGRAEDEPDLPPAVIEHMRRQRELGYT